MYIFCVRFVSCLLQFPEVVTCYFLTFVLKKKFSFTELVVNTTNSATVIEENKVKTNIFPLEIILLMSFCMVKLGLLWKFQTFVGDT